MLTKKDLKQIGEVVDERLDQKLDQKLLKFEERIVPRIVGDIVEQVGEMIEQDVLPEFERLEGRVIGIEASMVTKSYLDDKVSDLRGEFVLKRRGLA